MKSNYSNVEIYPKDHDMAKPWLVVFWFADPSTGQRKRFQFRGEINRKKTLRERIQEANSMRDAITVMLEDGWNPFNGNIESEREERHIPLSDLLDRLLEVKKSSIKPKSYRNYYDGLRWFKDWLRKKGRARILPRSFTAVHARAYVDFIQLEKGCNGKTVNGQVSYLKTFFNMMVEREIILKNPFNGIKKLRHDIGKNIAFNRDEKGRLAEMLREADEPLYHFVQFMYHCFLRRSEIIRVRVGDIDWVNKTIRVNSQDTKNRRQESVAIPSGFEPVLRGMRLERYPESYYIFSRYLLPGKTPLVKADHITARHKRFMELLEIPAGKTLYSWKHTGVVDYYNEVRDPYPIMQQLRHHSLSITMVYLKSLGLQPNNVIRNAVIKL